jgi:hypothetical protein
VNSVALELRERTRNVLEQAFDEIGLTLNEVGQPDVHISDGGPERGNAHYYRFEVVQSAEGGGQVCEV